MISVAALAGVPAWVRETFGDGVLRHGNHAAALDIELIEDQDCFIPQATMTSFLYEVERRAGEENLGLLLTPYLTFQTYGHWADYVLAAETLRGAIDRAVSTLGYHTSGDRMELSVVRGAARLSYYNATRGRAGYAHVAVGTAGVLLDLIRSYLSSDWRPELLTLDILRPRKAAPFEDAFLCPIAFEANAVSVFFGARFLNHSRRRHLRTGHLTLEDLARQRFNPTRPCGRIDSGIAFRVPALRLV
ncbi:AraC family transcriptional regulator ligand-binding domain-containing protein [Amaricoccus solimangrovi]|nr:AraC family transcriptional regulator ligand-binding domain-containing protein [Amaricoccus solimangrovi]